MFMPEKDESLELQVKQARHFKSQHRLGNFFVIPNAWDVPSARIFEEAGFTSIATSSAGMLVSLGYHDGESIPKREFVSAVKRITMALNVPLSVDMVSGFGRSPSQVVKSVMGILEAGAVGVNIEDVDFARDGLVDPEIQSRKIAALLTLKEETGIPFVINARTDAFSRRSGVDLESSLEEAIIRSERYIEAGADCVYPMGLADIASISHFVNSVKFPINVMIRKGLPQISDLKKLGVTRLSFGPSASYAAMGLLLRIGKEILERGNFSDLIEGAINYEMLNSLASKKK